MKKIYAVTLSALMAGTAFAGEGLTASPRISAGNAIALPEAIAGMGVEVSAPSRAPMSAIINPEGEKQEYIFYETGFYKSLVGAMPGMQDGITDIVWDRDNNKAYIHHPIGSISGGYVEGTISADGKTLTVKLPQLIGFLDGYDADNDIIRLPIYASVMEQVQIGGGYIDYVPVADAQNVAIYSISDDGKTVTMTSPYQADFETNAAGQQLMPEKYLSAYYEHDKSLWEILQPGEEDVVIKEWYIYGCINMKYSGLPEDVVTYEIPTNLDWEQNWRISGSAENNNVMMCKVAIQDGKFYVGNLIGGTNAVIVGTLAGDRVTFKNNQYMGMHPRNNIFMLLQGVNAIRRYDAENKEYYTDYELNGEDMVFNWDADNKELIFEGINKGMALNTSFVRVMYYSIFNEPEIVYQNDEDLCVVPARPALDGWWPGNPGEHVLSLIFSNVAPSGAVLNRENVYWCMYFDDDLYTFTRNIYHLNKDMTEFPIDFSKGRISKLGDITYIQIPDTELEGKKRLGICTINYAPNGEKYFSTMTAINLDGSGIEQIEAEDMPASVRYIDLQGREVKAPCDGQMVIKVAKYADGTVRATKIVK